MNRRITDLNNLTVGEVAPDDLLVIVDKSDQTSISGETKNITFAAFAQSVNSEATSSLVVIGPDSSSYYNVSNIVFRGTNLSASLSGSSVIVESNALIVYNSGSLISQQATSIDFVGNRNAISASVSGNNVSLMIKPSFLDLTDAPTAYNTSSLVVSNALGTGLTFIPISSISGSGTGGSVTDAIDQISHSFQLGDVVGRSGSMWVLAYADVVNDTDVVGVVSGIDTNLFVITYSGKLSGLSGLVDGAVYFLATSSDGPIPTRNVTTQEPFISKPVYIATSTSSAIITNQRGLVLEGSTASSGSGMVGSFTGSFIGSFIGNGSSITGVNSASYAFNSTTASFAFNSIYSLSSLTASYAVNSNSASYSISSSHAITSSYAQTTGTASSAYFADQATFAFNAGTASFADSSSFSQYSIYASGSATASFSHYAVTASFANDAETASFSHYAVTASYARSASYVAFTPPSASDWSGSVPIEIFYALNQLAERITRLGG